MLARLMTTIVHSTQIEKPMFSAKTEKAGFLAAIREPPCAQNASSSGSQRSIHRPRLRKGARVRVVPAVARLEMLMGRGAQAVRSGHRGRRSEGQARFATDGRMRTRGFRLVCATLSRW